MVHYFPQGVSLPTQADQLPNRNIKDLVCMWDFTFGKFVTSLSQDIATNAQLNLVVPVPSGSSSRDNVILMPSFK